MGFGQDPFFEIQLNKVKQAVSRGEDSNIGFLLILLKSLSLTTGYGTQAEVSTLILFRARVKDLLSFDQLVDISL